MRLLESGHTLTTAAQMVGAAVSAVWQWRETVRRRGTTGLAARPVPGRPRKLTARQRQRLPRLLARGARAYGYTNDLWTTKRVAAVIQLSTPVEKWTTRPAQKCPTEGARNLVRSRNLRW